VPDFTSGVTASDNCDTSLTITQDPAVGTVVGPGVTSVTITVTDDAGNTDTCSADFTVTEDTDPVISVCPAGQSASADSSCEATVPDFTTGVTASDNCDTSLTVTQDPAAGTTVGVGVHTITITVTDDAGNFDTCSADFTVTDDTDPVIGACAPDQTVFVDVLCEATVPNFTSTVSASDNCDTSLTITQLPVAGTIAALGDTTITITVTDDAGNFVTCTATLTVEDNLDPVVITPAPDQTVSANASCLATVPNFIPTLMAIDNCGYSVVQSPTAGTSLGLGAHTITLTITDNAGNSTTDEAIFTVEDTTDPVIVCPADSSLAESGGTAPTPDYTATATANDNCDPNPTITQAPPAGTPFGVGPHTITLTATDASGNFSECTVTFTVTSAAFPSVVISPITSPTNVTFHPGVAVTFSESVTGLLVSEFVGTGCTITNLQGSGANYTIDVTLDAPDGTKTITLPADSAINGDSNGNTVSNTVVVLLDTTAPSIGSLTSVGVTNTSPIAVNWVSVVDPIVGGFASGLAEVHLWYSFEGGAWTDSGLSDTTTSGSFSFTPPGGLEGVYEFSLLTVDALGNASSTPTGPGQTTTLYDPTAPFAGTVTVVPDFANTPFVVSYSGAADLVVDGSISNLAAVELWYSYEGGPWTASGLTSTNASDSFSFLPPGGLNGVYAFGMVATDNAGNSSASPSGSGDDSIIYDTIEPDPSTADIPAAFSFGPFTVNYGVAGDPTVDGTPSGFSGLALYYSFNGGPWVPSGLSSTTTSGSFTFIPTDGDGTYSVQLVAVDNAGNVSSTPSGFGDDTVTVVTDPSDLGVADSPPYDNTEPTIPVTYMDVPPTLPNVTLWFSYEGGPWTDSGLTTTGTTGSYDFFPPGNLEGEYHFGIVSNDGLGSFTPVPTGTGDTTTIYDLTDPDPGTADVTLDVTNAAFNVTYTGGFDPITDGTPSGLAEVQLWYSIDGGPWLNSGLTSTGGSGSFFFDPPGGTNGVYSFALVGVDNAGNVSGTPNLPGDDIITYDTIPPVVTNCPSDFDTPCNTNAGYNLTYTPFSIDATTTTYELLPANPLPYGTTLVTVVVTDEAGNFSICEFNVNVQPDLQPPVRVLSIGQEDGYLRAPLVPGGRSDIYQNYDTFYVGDSTNNGQFVGVLSFDTTGLPAGATVTSARIRLVRTSQQGTFSDFGEMRVAMGAPIGGANALEGSDWMLSSTTHQDVAEHIDIPTVNAVNTFVEIREDYLDAFNRNGRTQFQFAFDRATDGDGYFDYISFRAGDYVVELERPELIIEYVLEDCFEFPTVPAPTQGPFTTTIFSNQGEDGFVTEWHWSSEIGYLFNTNAPSFQVGDSGQRQQLMGMLSFDTSSIPANATIDSVEVRLYRAGASGNVASLGNLLIDMKNPYYSSTNHMFGSSLSLISDDFQAFANFEGVAIVGIPAKTNQYTSNVFLSPTGLLALNKGGTTQMRLRFELPDDGDVAVDAISFAAADYGVGSPARPRIIVTYRTP
jgi:hypothetical protein